MAPRRAESSVLDAAALNRLTATNLEKNEIFRPSDQPENGFGQEIGWGGRIPS
jgi:hypothetical protein